MQNKPNVKDAQINVNSCMKSKYEKMDILFSWSLIYRFIVTTAKLQLSETIDITDKHLKAASQFYWDGFKIV